MKLLVISDSHDNIVRLRHVLGFAKELNIDAVIHCGDWNTPLAVSEFSKLGVKKYGVLGNADIDPRMVQMLFEVCDKFDENFLELNLDGKKIGINHYPPSSLSSSGQATFSPSSIDRAITSGDYDVIFYGHNHTKKNEKYRKTLIVNPGALHRTNTPSFAVYDTETNQVEIVDVAI